MTDDAPQLRGELRTLSSSGTESRRVLGALFAGLLTVAALVSIVARNLGLSLALFAGSALAWFITFFGGHKLVETDGYWLLASDDSKTVWIPLRQVISVSRVWSPWGTGVQVDLGCDTPFGREIVFEPPFAPSALVGQHPVVEELRELVARAKRDTHR
jgi:hypothetical protein